MTSRMPAEDNILESAWGTSGTLAHSCLPEVALLLAIRFRLRYRWYPGPLLPPHRIGPTALKQGLIYSP